MRTRDQLRQWKGRWRAGGLVTVVAALTLLALFGGLRSGPDPAAAGTKHQPVDGRDLGQRSGLLPADHFTLESAIQVDLTANTVRLPLHKGRANGQTVWFVLLDSSDPGLANDLGVNYAPKLANIGIGCPACLQTVTLDAPSPAENRFGQAVVNFQGAPDFSPTRVATPGPNGFPLASFQPGAVAGPNYSPFIKIAGSDAVYSLDSSGRRNVC